mgnify:CR=1 FL=1
MINNTDRRIISKEICELGIESSTEIDIVILEDLIKKARKEGATHFYLSMNSFYDPGDDITFEFYHQRSETDEEYRDRLDQVKARLQEERSREVNKELQILQYLKQKYENQ